MYFILYTDNRGEWRWKYRAGNNEDIAVSSEGYKAKQNALYSISLVKQALSAKTYDDTLGKWLD